MELEEESSNALGENETCEQAVQSEKSELERSIFLTANFFMLIFSSALRKATGLSAG